MYSVDFLKDFEDVSEVVTFEYRLLCSGELYNSQVITSDWRKSDATRILLRSPCMLFVCSHPFDDYPQEISLKFNVPLVTERREGSTSSFYPDDDIALDLAALLTLYCRRLITIVGKIREVHPRRYSQEDELLLDRPVGFVSSQSISAWTRKPAIVIYGREGVSEIIDYNPPPLGVSLEDLKLFLTAIPSLPLTESFILSSRLYARALAYLETDVDRTYQLLISSIEAIAGFMKNYEPSDDEKIQSKLSVAKLAKQFSLSPEQANQIAIEACKGISWAKRKFKLFILDHAGEAIWKADEVFNLPDHFIPTRDNFEKIIDLIYEARAKLSHRGLSYPPDSIVGTGPTIPSRAAIQIFSSEEPFPPVVWFERVVNNVLNEYIRRNMVR